MNSKYNWKVLVYYKDIYLNEHVDGKIHVPVFSARPFLQLMISS